MTQKDTRKCSFNNSNQLAEQVGPRVEWMELAWSGWNRGGLEGVDGVGREWMESGCSRWSWCGLDGVGLEWMQLGEIYNKKKYVPSLSQNSISHHKKGSMLAQKSRYHSVCFS